jgi:hypothetical protein
MGHFSVSMSLNDQSREEAGCAPDGMAYIARTICVGEMPIKLRFGRIGGGGHPRPNPFR